MKKKLYLCRLEKISIPILTNLDKNQIKID